MQEFTPPHVTFIDQRLLQFPLLIYPIDQTEMAPHAHDFIEIVYVKRGSGLHVHGDKEYSVIRGDCFVVLPGDPHGYRAVKSMHIVNILFLPSILSLHLSHLKKIDGFRNFIAMEPVLRSATAFRYKLHLSAQQQERVDLVIEEIADELDQKRSGYETLCAGLFLKFLVMTSRFFAASAHTTSPLKSGGDADAVGKAITFLETQYDRKISLDDLASESCLSPSRLSHVFKESTGMPLFDFLINIRLDKAADLLKNPRLSIGEIAFATGFNDPNYFSRRFSKKFGLSPRELRSRDK